MTQVQWQHLESLIGAMTPDDRQRLVTMVNAPPAPTNCAVDAGAVAESAGVLGESAPLGRTPSVCAADLLRMTHDEQMAFLRHVAEQRKRNAVGHETVTSLPALASSAANDPFIGCMADDSELLDQIMEGIYHDRENVPLRAAE